MNERPASCASGCKTMGQHADGCSGDCKGCLPRDAEVGTLCAWCRQRLALDIAAAPDLVAHLRVIGEPAAAAAPPSDGRSYRDPSEGGVLPAAWIAADEVHAALASWVLVILEEHPNGAAMKGPDEVGAWHTRYGTTVGVMRDGEPTARMAAWLSPWLDWCAGQEWGAEMRREMSELIATTSARWPTASMVERRRGVAMPCPRCDRMSLTYAPPSVYRQPFQVSCGNPDCARVWTEDEWEWLVTMVAKGGRMSA